LVGAVFYEWVVSVGVVEEQTGMVAESGEEYKNSEKAKFKKAEN